MHVEDAPIWQTSGGTPGAGRRHSVAYAAPTTDAWTPGLCAANPGRGADKAAADLGDVVLDAVDVDGWMVTSAPRAAPHAHERTVTFTRPAAAGVPDDGAHGPSTLTVVITIRTSSG